MDTVKKVGRDVDMWTVKMFFHVTCVFHAYKEEENAIAKYKGRIFGMQRSDSFIKYNSQVIRLLFAEILGCLS